jgi:LIVCS family branched-chain amino acid:cation transporter
LTKIALPLLILSLIGSFGAIPRCITVVYGSISNIIPNLSAGIFNFVFCALAYFICLSEQRMINLLGKYLSPLLLFFLLALITLGTLNDSSIVVEASKFTAMQSFCNGFTVGYQTMDLLGALFFASLIFSQMQKKLPSGASDSDSIKFAVKASIVATILLSITYVGMVFLGANFANLIANMEAASMITTIANHVMGDIAMWCMSIIVALACLTTVVALNTIYAQYLCTLFHCENKFKFVLLGTTASAFFVSLFGFGGIANFLSPILDVLYPSIVALAIVSIFSRNIKLKTALFYGILAAILLCKKIFFL